MHSQPAVQVSFPVPVSLSSQDVPGSADPLAIPRQSRHVLFGTMPVVPPEQTPHASMKAVPFGTPAQSRSWTVPTQTHEALTVSLIVFALPSSQAPPI